MMWEIIKKQALIFIRNPQQLFLLLMLPVLLILILSTSLSGFISGDTVEIHAKVAFIDQKNEKEQIEKFKSEVEQSLLPEESKQAIVAQAEQLQLVNLLKNEAFQLVEEMIEIEEIPIREKEKAVKNDHFAAVVEIPENFTYNSLLYLFLNEGKAETITIYQNKGKEISAAAVQSIVEQFLEQITMNVFAANHQINPNILLEETEKRIGEIKAINQNKPITSKEYYTIGMAVMNVLYIATAIGSFAFMEKQLQVFNRIILSNMSRWTYFSGIFVSGTIFAMIQLLIIFSFSWIIYGVSWNILNFFIITLCLAFAIGGFSVILTALSYQMNSEAVINFFSTILVAFLALMGGSFFPLGDFSNVIQTVGDFTPNGASMTAYLSVLRGEGLTDIFPQIIYLLSFTISLLVIAVLSFPKRGQM